jgi:outer membrane protein OmpA-like peptidoglycan-associated protein
MNMGASINSGYDDFSLILDPEMKNGYFASNRLGGKGDDDIYKFKILKPFIFTKTIRGRSTDKSGNILPGATISLLDEQGNEVAKTVADERGSYSFIIDADDRLYSLEGNKDRFEKGVSPKVNTEGTEEVFIADVVLNRIPLNLVCELKDQDTNKPLGSVKVKITDKLTGETKEFETSANGDFTESLEGYLENDSMDFAVVFEKEGYEPKTVSLEKLRVVNGKVVIKENLVPLKLVVGKDLGELIKINPIYFDYNKYNIRKDAAEELDRIVKVMSDYPELVIELGSHTDCRGTYNYNETLSDKRAKSSAAYIASRISNPERIYGMGYGEKRLKAVCACEGAVKSNCSEENHQLNRRTEFVIISTTGFNSLNIDSLKQKPRFVNGKTVLNK